MKQINWLLAGGLFLLALTECTSSQEWARIVHIDPLKGQDKSSCCVNATCGTMDFAFQHCVENSTKFVLNSSTLHTLQWNGTFQNLNRIAVVGSENQTAIIVCDGDAGLCFINTSDITLQGVEFIGCGAIRDSTSRDFTQKDFRLQKFKVTLYFYQCQDVSIAKISVSHSPSAMGMALYDTIGTNVIADSTFLNNSVQGNDLGPFSGGGGAYIEFSYCKPGENNCNNASASQVDYNSNATYLFQHCKFIINYAHVLKENISYSTFIFPYKEQHESFGRGGGLSIYFKGSAKNNTITISECDFLGNYAVWGGGLLVEFDDDSIANHVDITSSFFEYNHCYYNNTAGTGGGAIRVAWFDHIFTPTPMGNEASIRNCTLKGNKALNGGALSIQPIFQPDSQTEMSSTTKVTVHNCTFIDNCGRLGSAVNVVLFPTLPLGRVHQVEFSNCVFIYNTIEYADGLLYSTGIGAMYVSKVPVAFVSSVLFEGNTGTAVGVVGTFLNFTSCNATFLRNTGIDGGAIALLGESYLLLAKSTNMTFERNEALHRGGAIYNNYIAKEDMKTYVNCFLRYGDILESAEWWGSRFTFCNNHAKSGNSIFSTSLLPCAWSVGSGIATDTSKIFCWNHTHWNYCYSEKEQNCSREIQTDPGELIPDISELPVKVFPGKLFHLPIAVRDDLNHTITGETIYSATSLNTSLAEVDPKFSYVAHNELALTGVQGNNIFLSLNTDGTRTWHYTIHIQIMECPPGLQSSSGSSEANKTTCTCPQSEYKGQMRCNLADYVASIRNGYWIGTTSNSSGLLMGQCPNGYCRTAEDDDFLLLPNTTAALDPYLCGYKNRTGELCGKCADGYGTAINNWYFECVSCNSKDTASRTVYYILSSYVPTFVFFFIIILFKIKLTTGPAIAFVLYAQMIGTVFEITAGGQITVTAFHGYASQMVDAYRTIYGIFNLDFSYVFHPFCLSPKLNTLDVLQLDYLVAVLPLLMIVAVVAFLKMRFCSSARCLQICIKRQPQRQSQDHGTIWRFTNSLVHAFVAFILLSYTKFSVSSTYILSSTPLTNENGLTIGSRRVSLAGHYCIDDHDYVVRYGLLSYFITATFVILPPLLLLGPLNWFEGLVVPRSRIVRKFWPSDKVNIILDTFQGCYKPKMRFFAGLYFLFRILIFVNYVARASILQQYIVQQLLCCGMIALLAIFQPYRRQLFNYVDTLIFFNLAILNSLSLYILMQSIINPDLPFPEGVFITQYILIYLPLIYMISYLIWYFTTHPRFKVFLMACCGRWYPEKLRAYSTLLDSTSLLQASSTLREDDTLLERAEEPNTYQPYPSIQSRSVRFSTNGEDSRTGESSSSSSDHRHSGYGSITTGSTMSTLVEISGEEDT